VDEVVELVDTVLDVELVDEVVELVEDVLEVLEDVVEVVVTPLASLYSSVVPKRLPDPPKLKPKFAAPAPPNSDRATFKSAPANQTLDKYSSVVARSLPLLPPKAIARVLTPALANPYLAVFKESFVVHVVPFQASTILEYAPASVLPPMDNAALLVPAPANP